MTKKIYYALPVFLLLLIVAAVYFGANNNKTKNVIPPEGIEIDTENATETDSEEVKGTSNLGDLNNNDKDLQTGTEDAVYYEVSDGTDVYYSVQKTYIGRPGEIVTGKTEKISGSGWVDTASDKGNLQVSLDFKDLQTSSSKRDQDVIPLFVDTDIKVLGNLENVMDFEFNDNFNAEIPLLLTVNGITKQVLFKVEGNFSRDKLNLKGTASVKMSDFNIDPPSLLNVFSVSEDVVIGFDLKAASTNKPE